MSSQFNWHEALSPRSVATSPTRSTGLRKVLRLFIVVYDLVCEITSGTGHITGLQRVTNVLI